LTNLLEQSVLNYPKIPEENIKYRLNILRKAEDDKLLQSQIKEICKQDILFWINLFCWTKDPRRVPDVMPFICYESFQEQYILDVQGAIDDGHDMLTDKSRDMGVSWMVLYVLQHKWLFERGSDFRVGSRKEDFVDKPKVMDTLFEKLRFNFSRQPIWLKPKGFDDRSHSSYMKLHNPELGNTITGESANDNFGSGGRSKAIMLDEFAKWDKSIQVSAWTATADVTNCRLPVSTPLGSGNKFAELAKGAKEQIKKISLHWTLHPAKAKGCYRMVKGEKVLISTPQEAFKLWNEGIDVRSPWYDNESNRRSKADLAQEVDIDYKASGYPFFDLPALDKQVVWPYCVRQSPFDRIPRGKHIRVNLVQIDNKIEARERPDGWLRVFELPEPKYQYAVGGDTSEGLPKGDEAFGVIRNKYTRNVVACANGLYDPDQWAVKLHLIGKYYNDGHVAPENNNHGYSVCSDLKELDCNLFWTERKSEDGSVHKVKAGFTTDARSRPEMLDQMEEEIRNLVIELRDEVLIVQCGSFIRNEKTGKPEADGNLLDDGVMACAIAGAVIKLKPYKPNTDKYGHKEKQMMRQLTATSNMGLGFSGRR